MGTMATSQAFDLARQRSGLGARIVGVAMAACLLFANALPSMALGLDGAAARTVDGQDEALDPINAFCPVTLDEPIEDELFLDIDGERIGFCCKKCVRKYAADPEFFAEGLAQVRLVAKSTGPDPSAHEENLPAQQQGQDHGDIGQGDAGHDEANPADSDGEDHDHATGHGDVDAGFWSRLKTLAGKLHPLAVHLPIGIGIFAALAEAIFMLKGDRSWRKTAIAAMLFAALGALGAAPLGWLAATDADFPRSLVTTLLWHRYVGLAVLAWLWVGVFSSRKAREGDGQLFRVMALGAPFLIGWAGHLGGSLVFGAGYFSW